MLTDLRNSKGRRELNAVRMKILVSGVNQECFEPCAFTLYVLMKGSSMHGPRCSLLWPASHF